MKFTYDYLVLMPTVLKTGKPQKYVNQHVFDIMPMDRSDFRNANCGTHKISLYSFPTRAFKFSMRKIKIQGSLLLN